MNMNDLIVKTFGPSFLGLGAEFPSTLLTSLRSYGTGWMPRRPEDRAWREGGVGVIIRPETVRPSGLLYNRDFKGHHLAGIFVCGRWADLDKLGRVVLRDYARRGGLPIYEAAEDGTLTELEA